jgi:8-oxo-dGTP pyrophosphatase MutT (NUDIX family)
LTTGPGRPLPTRLRAILERLPAAILQRLPAAAWILQRLPAAAPERQVAAAVAVRESARGEVEFLLVRTRDGARWTFPKGHRERGETLAQAAAREAVEEAGVSGAVGSERLARYRYPSARGGADLVTAFLLRVEREGLPAEADREPTWLGFDAARSRLAIGREPGYGEEMERLLLTSQRRWSAGPRDGGAGGTRAC